MGVMHCLHFVVSKLQLMLLCLALTVLLQTGVLGGLQVWDERLGPSPASRSRNSWGHTGCGLLDKQMSAQRQVCCTAASRPQGQHLDSAHSLVQGVLSLSRRGAYQLCAVLGLTAAAVQVAGVL